ncbi:MAG: arabinan endo-1,5-alpha-L-arabinosidase [Eubacterium sp.]|nr:arabinan endo-1,5-alpha-L-arabinosidase [Eubacterium sp.]
MSQEIKYPVAPPEQPPRDIFSGKFDQKDLGLWLTHDPAIFQDPDTDEYFIYGTDAICQRSKDLIHWDRVGKVVEEPTAESQEWVGTKNIWAPDMVKVGDEYRLYCSNSSFGSQTSCIFTAVSKKPEGPFEPKDCVVKTNEKAPLNAIDANIIRDEKNGKMYMVYGSFWGGIYILELDEKTGLAAEEGFGKCIATRPAWLSGAIEGPYVIYNEKTDYYYLFVSYGSLKSDYQIRVARSKDVLGPYVDFNGREMTDTDDPYNQVGQMVFCGYQWSHGVGYMGPGHNSVLHNKEDQWFLVYHIRQKNFVEDWLEPSTMQIRKIFWTETGWPIVSPEPYAGEVDQEIPLEAFFGKYERINLVKSLPQGIQTAVPMKINRCEWGDYYESSSIQGNWVYENGKFTITYGPHTEECFVTAIWDHERKCPSLGLCGLSQDGVPFIAKRIGDLPER